MSLARDRSFGLHCQLHNDLRPIAFKLFNLFKYKSALIMHDKLSGRNTSRDFLKGSK